MLWRMREDSIANSTPVAIHVLGNMWASRYSPVSSTECERHHPSRSASPRRMTVSSLSIWSCVIDGDIDPPWRIAAPPAYRSRPKLAARLPWPAVCHLWQGVVRVLVTGQAARGRAGQPLPQLVTARVSPMTRRCPPRAASWRAVAGSSFQRDGSWPPRWGLRNLSVTPPFMHHHHLDSIAVSISVTATGAWPDVSRLAEQRCSMAIRHLTRL